MSQVFIRINNSLKFESYKHIRYNYNEPGNSLQRGKIYTNSDVLLEDVEVVGDLISVLPDCRFPKQFISRVPMFPPHFSRVPE